MGNALRVPVRVVSLAFLLVLAGGDGTEAPDAGPADAAAADGDAAAGAMPAIGRARFRRASG
jgi:hypothetical protein